MPDQISLFEKELEDLRKNFEFAFAGIEKRLPLKNKTLQFKTCDYPTISARALDFAINNSTANKTLIISDYQHINHSLILLGRG